MNWERICLCFDSIIIKVEKLTEKLTSRSALEPLPVTVHTWALKATRATLTARGKWDPINPSISITVDIAAVEATATIKQARSSWSEPLVTKIVITLT